MEKLIISVLGDSITEGGALLQPDGSALQNWQDIVSKIMNAQFHSFGVGGSTVSGGLARVQQLLGFNNDYVLIEFGMNDSVICSADGSTKTPLKQFCKELAELHHICKQKGAKPVFMTPNMVIEEYYYERHPKEWYDNVGGANAQIKRYRDAMLEVAKQCNCPVIDIWQEYNNHKDAISTLLRTEKQGNFRDGVHPYGAGIQLYADAVLAFFKKEENVK